MVCVSIAGMAASLTTAYAEELIYSGFMTDYTQLRKVTDGSADYRYVAPGAEDRLSNYNAIMIDQPEIFVAPDSKYGGIKPDEMKALADAFRTAVAQEISNRYYAVDQPGPAVLYLRIAASNLYLKKKKKSILGYTPQGMVLGSVKSAVTKDLTKKIDLKRLTVEMEVLDSESGERLVALIESRGEGKENPASWDELEAIMSEYGKRISCRLDNARMPEAKRVDCINR